MSENNTTEILEQISIISTAAHELGKWSGTAEMIRTIRKMSGDSYAGYKDERAKFLRELSDELEVGARKMRERYDAELKPKSSAAYARIEELLKVTL